MKARLIKSLLALLLASSALILIAAAVLHGWVVPHIDDVRPCIEAYVSEKTGQSVRIGSITAESSGLLPSFDLKGVRVLDANLEPAWQLERVQVSVSPLSLLMLEVDNLTIDAPVLSVARNAAGQITIAGFTLRSQGKSSKGLDWIFSQKKIVIQGGTLHWLDEKSNLFGTSEALPAATFKNVAVTLSNGLRSHNLHLEATPPKGWGETFIVTGKFIQPLLEADRGHWQTWTGGIDVQIKNIPALASHIKAHVDWPLRHASIEGEQLTLTPLAKLAQFAGYSLPPDAALEAALSVQATYFKLRVQDIQTDKLHMQLDAKFANTDLAGALDIHWEKASDKLMATTHMERIDLAALHRYLPERLLPKVRQSLRTAIRKGTATDVRATVKGALKEFPFTNSKASELRITGKVVNAELTAVDLAKTSFAFDLNGMQLDIKNITTTLAGLTSEGSMQIADIRRPVLDIQTKIKGDLASVSNIVKKEPLKTFVPDIFASTEVTGLIAAELQMTVPLAAPAQSKVTGQLQLQDNSFTLNATTPALTHLRGTIHFNQAGFQLDNFHGMLLGGEIKLSGGHQKMIGTGTISSEGLAAWSTMPMHTQLVPRMHGKTPYTLSLEPHIGGSGLVFESTLVGMQLDLPFPLTKPAASSWPLRVQKTKVTTVQDQLTITLGDVLAGKFVHSLNLGKAATQGSFILGAGAHLNDLVVPEQGVSAYMKLDQLDLTLWSQMLVRDKSDSTPSHATSAAASYIPSQIAAQIGTLKFANRSFTHVVLGASQAGHTWRINANASDFNGYAEYRPQSEDQAGQVYVRLAKLVVSDASSKSQIEQLLQAAPDRIPALDVIVDDFEVTGKKVGRIEMLAINQRSQGYLGSGSAQEWRVQKLNITNSDATLKATGVWLPSSDAGSEMSHKRRVDVQFNLEVADFGALLSRFGLPGTIKAGKGSLQGRTAWVGSPWAINIPTLTGQLKMAMSKGQFLKIEPGRAGRFFNVISLQALPRLLTLDFRDVFSEGFAFDSLSGDAYINNGVLNSKNLQMKSVLALVSIDGLVDLTKETQDLHVLVLPDLNAGGASLIATLINPVVGATTYLAQLILRRPVVAAATKEYSIQGSWQEPKITPRASAP